MVLRWWRNNLRIFLLFLLVWNRSYTTAFINPSTVSRHVSFVDAGGSGDTRRATFQLPATVASAEAYSQARFTRTQQGHDAAQPLFQQLLEENSKDITAATRIAAAPATPDRHDLALVANDGATTTTLREDARRLRTLLTTARYVNDVIVERLGLPPALADTCAGPGIFLTPASAGSSTKLPFARTTEESPEALECLVAMFLLGLAVPAVAIHKSIGQDAIDLFQRLGLAFPCQTDPSWIVPYLHIFPLTIRDMTKSSKTLWLLTDLHPRVLSTTTVGSKEDGTVMYIGPDSLALVQHFITSISELRSSTPTACLDVCTGSGVQALAALATMESIQSATVLDINPRALRFAHFNAVLNGLDHRLQHFILGDLVSGQGKTWQPNKAMVATESSPLLDLLTPSFSYQDHRLVLANPPFLPVPSHDAEIKQRYGLFSDGGGPSGERVLQAIVELSAAVANQANSNTTTALVDVGIVSEYVNPPLDTDDDDGADSNPLLHRMTTWWQSPRDSSTQGILFTNEFPVDATTYAERRADDGREAQTWLQHLEEQGITHLSPGLLYIRSRRPVTNITSGPPTGSAMQLQHVLVPKTRAGSIWTPNNPEAVAFIHERAKAKLWRTSSEHV